MRKKVIYIAGPFRAANAWEVELNIRCAEELALEVWRVGGVALCPHLNTRHFSGTMPDEVWLAGDLELLHRCDAVMLVPGWESSKGANHEVAVAINNGIRVFYEEDFLKLKKWIAAS